MDKAAAARFQDLTRFGAEGAPEYGSNLATAINLAESPVDSEAKIVVTV